MRLFHVSEEADIKVFIPRKPARDDLDKTKKYVWAITEKCLPNFLVPRDCPRAAYHVSEQTTKEDILSFFSAASRHVVAIEHEWYRRVAKTILYLYEFDTSNFYLQDECAGYYISESTETPVSVTKIDDTFDELIKRSVEIRIIDELWTLGEDVQKSTLNWSLCRMRNAKQRALMKQ